MVFYFKDTGQYVEALEYLLRISISFKHNNKTLKIEIDPIDHDQLPIYDETVVGYLNRICGDCATKDNADALLAKEILQKNVAG